jgi:hypothetical protein
MASSAYAVGRTRGSTRAHSARTVPDTSGVVAPAAAEAAMIAEVGAPPRTTASSAASVSGYTAASASSTMRGLRRSAKRPRIGAMTAMAIPSVAAASPATA